MTVEPALAWLGGVLRLRHATMAYRAADNHVYTAVRGFLTRRHKVPREAPAGSQTTRYSGTLACSGFAGCTLARRRQWRGEASRKAGCGKSARPV